MKYSKKILLLSIFMILIVFINIFSVYLSSDEENIMMNYNNYNYIAMDSTTALKSIELKKEIIDAKEYYKAGDDIKYKITITNNNAETVKVNLQDNYSNLETNQSNLVLENVKCNEKDVSFSWNELSLNDIEIASKETYTCTVDAYTKKTYPEGKVNSRVKVYIDDEDEYNESGFTYMVRDSILEIEQSINKYILYYKEQAEYKVVIRNVSKEIASGPVDIKVQLDVNTKVLNLNSDFYEVSSSGAVKNLVNSNFKASCKTNDGKTCNINEIQNISFKSSGINPGETVTLIFKFNDVAPTYYIVNDSINVNINEYNQDKIIKNTYKHFYLKYIGGGQRVNDLQGEIYFSDNSNNLLNDFHDLEYRNGWASIVLNNNFYRTPADIFVPTDQYDGHAETQVNEIKPLPVGMEYDVGKTAIITGCASGSDSIYSIDYNRQYEILSTCKMKNSNYIYNGNIKVPLKITNEILNEQICIEGENQPTNAGKRNDETNKYCIGPNLYFKSSNVVQEGDKLDIKLKVTNGRSGTEADDNLKYSFGRAQNVKLTYTYEEGLEIDKSSLTDAVINESKKTITWTIPLIRPEETIEVNVKAKNTTNLTSINLTGDIEGKKYEEKVTIVKEEDEVLKGDWNQNGKLDLLDLPLCRKYLAAYEGITKPKLEIIDMNDDGEFNIIDLSLLRRYFATSYNP